MSSYTIFKVIRIIDEKSIVINGGINEGVSLYDNIEVFVEGDEVLDPFNDNMSLGTLDFIKDTLKVTEIYKHFSVCKKIIEEEIYEPSSLEKAVNPFTRGKTVTIEREENINVKKEEIEDRKKDDPTIKIGDDARISLT